MPMMKGNEWSGCLLLLLCFCAVLPAQDRSGPVRRKGFSVSRERYDRVPLAEPLTRGPSSGPMPAECSLKDYVPKPGDQGDRPTNAAWAVVYGAYTCLKALQTETSRPATGDVPAFSPGYLYAVAVRDSALKCEQGINVTEALDALATRGTVALKDYPADCGKIPPPELEAKAARNRISAYRKLFGDRVERKELPVRKSLAEKKPVVGVFWYVSSFDDAGESWSPTKEESMRYFNDRDTGVAVTIVGYDDSRFGGAFEVMNSEGTGWGKDGFSWISYRVFNQFCAQAFQMIVDSSIGLDQSIKVPDIVAAPTPADATIGGAVKFFDLSQREFPAVRDSAGFRLSDPLPAGAKFKMQIAVQREAYVYVLTADDRSAKTSVLFPYLWVHGTARMEPDSQLVIPPPGMGYLELDSSAMKDYFCVIYSRAPIEISAEPTRIDRGEGTFIEKCRRHFADTMVDPGKITFSEYGDMSFWTAESDKSAIAVFITIEHKQ